MSIPNSTGVTSGLSASRRVASDRRSDGFTGRPRGLAEGSDSVVHLSSEARGLLAAADRDQDFTLASGSGGDPAGAVWSRPTAEDPPDANHGAPSPTDPSIGIATVKEEGPSIGRKPPSPEQQREIEQLRARDTEVQAHEAAHAAAAGSLGGRTALEYVTGPDGKRYAVAGEISIDTSPGRTPEETITRARTIRAAATAPSSPSAQDMAVASDATQMEAQARAAIRERQQIENRSRTDSVDTKRETAPQARPATSVESGEATDPDMILSQLSREQISAQGGMGHSHLAVDCGFCQRAARVYA